MLKITRSSQTQWTVIQWCCPASALLHKEFGTSPGPPIQLGELNKCVCVCKKELLFVKKKKKRLNIYLVSQFCSNQIKRICKKHSCSSSEWSCHEIKYRTPPNIRKTEDYPSTILLISHVMQGSIRYNSCNTSTVSSANNPKYMVKKTRENGNLHMTENE